MQCSSVQFSQVQCCSVQYSPVFSTVQCSAVQCSAVKGVDRYIDSYTNLDSHACSNFDMLHLWVLYDENAFEIMIRQHDGNENFQRHGMLLGILKEFLLDWNIQ